MSNTDKSVLGKPIYKILDGKGRILIPKELRAAAGMDYGNIVRLGVANGRVSVRKVDIIEVGDQSPEAVEAFVRAAFKTMPDDIRLSLIAELTELLKQKKEM
ncbi:division/cell wall cluster transcriptional repressor MraZ [Faecalispora anaeroviscerum]|uniref:AbrB family transcriptional regulator n=1 Tax=Faecalispora anaeroviscerum TaxID=2991836 RepID=UPI002FDCFFC1